VLLAIGGLAAVDLLLLLPLLFAVVLILLIAGLVMCVLGIIGIGLLLSLFKLAGIATIATLVLRALAGIALITASVGLGTLLVLGLNVAVRKLGGYARLHYRLLKPDRL
jgi:hypothetical protein